MSVKRAILHILLIFFAQFLVETLTSKNERQLIFGALVIFVLTYVSEFFLQGNLVMKPLWAGSEVRLPKFEGPAGFSNISAFMLSTFTLVAFVKGYKKLLGISVFLLLFLISKTAFLVLLFGFSFLAFRKASRKTIKATCWIVLALIIGSPLWLYLVESYASQDFKLLLNRGTNSRYLIQVVFLKVFWENPWGVGFYKGHLLFKDYMDIASSVYPSSDVKMTVFDLDPHSSWIQVLAELGWWGFLIFSWFNINILRIALKRNNFGLSWVFLATLLAMCSLNGLNEIAYYYIIALIVASHKDELDCT